MATPWLQVLQIVRKGGPSLAKQLPKLWPLLLESKNREKVGEIARDLASQSPTKRLRARVELTAQMAEGISKDASTEEEEARATEWAQRSRNLTRRLDMPIEGRKAKAEHRESVKEQLDALQAEMNAHLGQ
jgi:arginine/lysine/ornithine decarboxylase